MILNHLRARPQRDYTGPSLCPECDAPLIAKCGRIVVWHWAHAVRSDCPISTETEWHLKWKSLFPTAWIERPYGSRRADVLLPSGEVIEFQRAGLGVETIEARERECRGRIQWVCDGTRLGDRFNLREPELEWHEYRPPGWRTFRWKHPAKSWMSVRGRLMIDFGDSTMFHIVKVGTEVPVGGYGNLVHRDPWAQAILKQKQLPLAPRMARFPTRGEP